MKQNEMCVSCGSSDNVEEHEVNGRMYFLCNSCASEWRKTYEH